MLQRYVIHFALAFLFAFTQIGVATHEISHLADSSQQDTKSQSKQTTTTAEQCEQCISYAKVANALQLPAFAIPAIRSEAIAATSHFSDAEPVFSHPYSARAPPQIISI